MADIVELNLLAFLKNNAFKPGDALPKELELAEALGVSRNILREALSRLPLVTLNKANYDKLHAELEAVGFFERVPSIPMDRKEL